MGVADGTRETGQDPDDEETRQTGPLAIASRSGIGQLGGATGVGSGSPRTPASEVGGGHLGHLGAGRPRRRRDVRHDQAVVEPDQRVVHRDRLGVGDVEGGGRR